MRTTVLLTSFILTAPLAAATGTWEVRPPLPVAKAECFATVWNGSLYVVGGAPWRNGGDLDGSVYRMNDIGTWTEVEPLSPSCRFASPRNTSIGVSFPSASKCQ